MAALAEGRPTISNIAVVRSAATAVKTVVDEGERHAVGGIDVQSATRNVGVDQIVFGLVDETGAHAIDLAELSLEPSCRFVSVRRLDVGIELNRALERCGRASRFLTGLPVLVTIRIDPIIGGRLP